MFFISIFISEYIAERNILFFFAVESKQLNNQQGKPDTLASVLFARVCCKYRAFPSETI